MGYPTGVRPRKPRTELAAALGVAILLAGCGAAERQRSSPPPPRLQRDLASSLAAQSDGVAAALSAGNPCGALALAQDLQQQTIAAINAGRVPQALQEPLQGSVNQLAAHISCPVAPEKHKKHRRHKHDQNQNEGGD